MAKNKYSIQWENKQKTNETIIKYVSLSVSHTHTHNQENRT